MSKAAHRKYHHGDLRHSLIEAACRHLVESGADTLSLRALAREIGVSQTAPYRHFESKNALFAAIAIHGFELLRDELQAASDKWPDDIEKALIEIGLVYLSWAKRHPEKYQLFFDSSLVDFGSYDELLSASTATFEVLLAVIRRGIEEDVFVDRPISEVAGGFWASIHGAASLILTKAENAEQNQTKGPVSEVLNQLTGDPKPILELFLNSIRKPC